MKKIYFFTLLFFVFLGNNKLSAQVDVTATSGTLTASYTTLKAAFDAINLGTHKGDIIIDISGNTVETAPAVINSGDADPASYTSVLIEPVIDGVSISGAPGAGRGVIELNGADNVFIIGDNPLTAGTNRNLTIANTSASAVAASSVIRIATRAVSATTADNNFILNCILNGNVTAGNAAGITLATSSSNVSFGIYCGGNAGPTNITAPTAITSATADAAPTGTTIDNLVIDNNQINQCGRGIVFNGAVTSVATSLTITNNVIGASGVLGAFPFAAPATTVYAKGIWVAGTEALYINNNAVRNIISYLTTTITGIELASAIGTNLLDISANTITGIANNNGASATNDAFGILVSAASNKFTVTGNRVSTIQNIANTPVAGIKIANTVGSATINQNIISGVFARSTGGWGSFGVYLATAANGAEISNNFIYDIMNVGNSSFSATAENASGILIASGVNHKIYHNSVHLSGASGATATNVITCLSVAANTITGLDIRNNIFSNVVTGGSATDAHVCFYFPFAASAGLGYTINNNAYYTGAIAGKSGIAFTGTNTYATGTFHDAANFNAASTIAPAGNFRIYSSATGLGSNDFASFASTLAAPFTSGTDLHIPAATATRLESGAVPVGIIVDIDNAARSATTPDIGADEFVGTPQDLTPPLIVYTPLAGTCVLGNRTLTATITDASGVGTGANLPRLWWRINAAAYVLAPAPVVAGNNYTFTFGAGAAVGDVVSYYIVAQDNAGTPNVISQSSIGAGPFTNTPPAATVPPTTPDSYNVQNNLGAGTYTVGGAGFFPTLTAAVNAYNTSCLGGPVIFDLIDANYPSETYPITIGNPDASFINTLTIKPAPGVNATITGASAVALIKFNGADYVTIDGSNAGTTSQNLTITNTDPGTNSAVIWVASASAVNGATNNVIKNCIIAGNASNTTFFGIVASSGTTVNGLAEAANTSNIYRNNTITTASYGIALVGAAAGENTNTIIDNKIGSAIAAEKIGFRGIYIANQNSVTITNNTVLGIASNASGSITRTEPPGGIIVKGAITNGIINLNKISDCKNSNTGGWPVHGITLGSSTLNSGLRIYNNFIYDVASYGWPSIASDNGHGIGIILGGGYNIYFNSINLNTNQTNPSGTISAAIYILNGPAQLNIRNNIFSNQQSTNVRYSIYSEGTAAAFTSINYNDYFTTGTNLGFLSGTRNNLAAWQTGTGADGNSVSVNPVFITPTNLHLQTTSPSSTLNAQATPIAGIATDIDGDVRNLTTPDIGADEFTPDPCGGIITAGTITASQTTVCVSAGIVFGSTTFSTGTGMTYQWESSPDNASWSAIPGETNPSGVNVTVSTTTYFRLSVTCTITSTTATSNVILVTVTTPTITASSGGSVCGLGTVNLSATGSAGTTVFWYANPTGGLPLASGPAYATPVISSTTNYYAEAVAGASIGAVGPSSPTAQGGSIGTQTVSWDVGFDVIQATTLLSVDVFPLTSGVSTTLNVYNSSNTILISIPYTTTVSGGATAQTIPINLALPAGTGYYIEDPNFTLPGSGYTRNTSGAVYPYTSAAINITGNGFDQNYFMCYYNWQFSSGCASAPRTTVVATVSAPPPYTAPTASANPICAASSTNITGADADYTIYSWTPATGLSNAAIANPVATPASTTTYTVTASNGVCATSADITITVNPIPGALTIVPANPVVCAGSTQSLTATGGAGDFFRERFEVFPISKFAVTGTGITENQTLTYFQEGASAVRLTHTNNISDASPAAYEVANSINLSLYSNPVLTFQHICALETNATGTADWDFGYVEYSTDGGTTWTPFPQTSYTVGSTALRNGVVCFEKHSYPDWNAQFTTPGSTPGAGPATALWKPETIDLSPWQTSNNFKFRFRIKSDVSDLYYGWLLDNIKINGQASITWGPVLELFTDPGASIPYAGTNNPVVYVKPTATRPYTATAAFGTCSVTASVTPTVTANPISITIAANPGTTICNGYPVDFSITAQNIQGSANPLYNWQINGVTPTGSAINGAGASGQTIVTVTSTSNLYVGMRVTVSAGIGNFAVNSRIVSIISPTQFSVSANIITTLVGATISATASGSTVTSFSYSNIANGDNVTCVLTVGGVACVVPFTGTVTSNTVGPFTVNPSTATSVSISPALTATVCAGLPLNFTATPVNGGAAPTYEWFVNGVSQGVPSVSNLFSISTLTNGQVVTCRMVSNAVNCPLPINPVSSGTTVTVNPSFPVSVALAANPGTSVCAATSVTYTATPTNGGATPLYEFFVNGVSVQGPGALTTYTYTPADLDLVEVVLTSSLPSCATGNPATTGVTMNITILTVTVALNPSTAICSGIPRLYTATPTNGGGSPLYEFFINGVSQGAPSATATLNYTPVNGDLIAVNLQSSLGGCASPNPATTSFIQTVNAAPTASITGNNVLCPGVPVLLNSNAVAGSGSISSIQWKLGGVDIVGATAATYLATAIGNYTVAVTNSNTCTVTSAIFTITASPSLMAGPYTIGAVTATGANSIGTTVTVASTANLVVGAVLFKVSGGGTIAANTVITSIINGTTFTVNTAPAPVLAGASIAGATCTNYISFATAIADLNSRAISANCTFNVTPGYVENITAQLKLGSNAGPNLNATLAGRSIVFQKAGAGVNPVINAAYVGVANPNSFNPDGIWSLNGIDNITIDGIDLFDNNSANQTVCMEFGYGLFKLASTDGAQNNTIRNCSITLNKVNNGAGAGPMPAGSTGILVVNSIVSNATAALVAGGAAGANSNNKFYTNSIQNCNGGIVLSGLLDASPFTNADVNNDVGGVAPGTGNTITNYAGGGVVQAVGIRITNQWSANISFNTVTSNAHNGVLKGIWGEAGVSASININNNNVTVAGGGTITTVNGIENAIGSTAAGNTVNINNNTVTGSYATATNGSWTGINNTATAFAVNITGNTVQNVTLPGTLGNNFFGILSTAAITAGSSLRVNGNTVTNNTKTTTGIAITQVLTPIQVSGPVAGSLVEVRTNTVSNNTIVGGANTANLFCISVSSAGTVTATDNIVTNNAVTGMSGATIATIHGYSNASTTPTETVNNNSINNLYVTGVSTGLHVVNGIRHNTVNTSTRSVSNNTIFNLYSSAGVSAVITGINSSSVLTLTCAKNRIYNLFPGQSATAGSIAKGIAIAGGSSTTWNVSNNMISLDLTLAAASTGAVAANAVLTGADAVRGIEITSAAVTSTLNIYYNTIRLAGTGGAGFGSTGIFHTTSATATTASLNLRNNIIDNESAPNGGLVVAYRRSGIALNNFAATSNNNLFYAGVPSATRLIFYDGTNSDQTIAAYKTRVAARDAASVSDLPNFVSTTDLHLSLDNNCIINGLALPIAGFTDDYDANPRDAATPDIGFDEFLGTNPVSLTVTAPSATCTPSTVDLTAAAVTAGSSGGTAFYYYTDAGGTITLATPAAVAASGTYYIKYGKGSCYSAVTAVPVTINATGTWLGIDNNWNNAANWCGGVPNGASNVTIPTSANYPNITGAAALVNNITLTGAATVTIAAGGTLRVAGAVTTPDNRFDATAGTFELNGAAAQSLRANHFTTASIANLVISNTSAGGVTIDNTGSMLNITTEVNFGNNNNQKFNTSNLLTLKSTATATARIADVTLNSTRTGNDVVGKVVIERFIPARRAWRLLTAPIKSSTIPTPTIYNNWQESARSFPLGTLANPVPGFGTHVSYGLNVPDFDQNNTNNSSIFYLTPLGWRGVPTNTSGTVIGANNGVITDQPGYMLFVRGDRSTNLALGTGAPASATTLRTTGEINVTSNAAAPLLLNGSGSYPTGPDFAYTYANPYPSAISFEQIYTEPLNAGMPNIYYIWDANLTGSNSVGGWVTVTRTGLSTYSTSPNTAALNTGEIQSGMAFMLKFPAASQVLRYKEAFKVSGSTVLLYRPVLNQIRTTLMAKNTDGTTSVNDGTLLIFNDAYNQALDREDATKMPNFTENLSIVKDGVDLTIEKRKFIQENDTVFFRMSKMRNKEYSFSFELDGFKCAAGLTPVLEDLFLKSKTMLNIGGATNYNFNVAANTPSADSNRFRIVFKKLISFTRIEAQVVNTDIAVNWSVSSELGIHHYEVERSTNGTSFESVAGIQLSNGNTDDVRSYSLLDLNPTPGVYYYRIKCVGNNGAIAYSDMAKVTIAKGSAHMYVFPNPVTGRNINIQMNGAAPGIYQAILHSEDGKVVNSSTINHAGGKAVESIDPGRYLPSGAYQLEIVGADRKKTILNVIVQMK